MSVTAYEVILADTETARRIHYQIRYHIYCLQAGYENPAFFPEEEEKDAWDPYSAHFLVRSRETREWVGAMRLILPGSPSLPIEQRTTLVPPYAVPQEGRAELSRLCLVGQDPMPIGTDAAGQCVAFRSAMKQRRRTGEVLLALMCGAVAYSRDHGIHHWYFLTTQSLSRIVSKLTPLNMTQVGDPCWHRGERYPYITSVAEAAQNLGWSKNQASLARWPAYRCYSETRGKQRRQAALPPVRECVL